MSKPITPQKMKQIDEEAIKKMLVMNNKDLDKANILITKSQRYPGYCLRIMSEDLVSIGTLRTCGNTITELDVSNSKVKDIAAISGTNIRALDISNTKVTSLPMLSSVPLERLIMRGVQVKDIGALSRTKLKVLDISGTKIADLRPIQHLPLESLDMNDLDAKAPDLLLKAFAELVGDSRAHLVIVGNGPLELHLRKMQQALGLTRVHWAGFINQSELPAYYRAADVMVLPSRFEPWGLVVNEAMACGTPCIVSSVVGAGADLVEGQETGRVFRSGDVGDLVNALRSALDPDVRRRWAANLSRILKRASFRQNIAALESLLQRVSAP